ncbi:MAG: hypothetical protein GY786_11045, partial [Proteobacteria bacterium]|nr:hypothetical protein [Pseudomonadota bacterium]
LRTLYPDEWYHFSNPSPSPSLSNKYSIEIDVGKRLLPVHYLPDSDVRITHMTVIVFGDFSGLSNSEKQHLITSLTVVHEDITFSSDPSPLSGDEMFRTKTIGANEQFIYFSTRDPDSLSFKVSTDLNPVGKWSFSIENILLSTGENLLGRLKDIIAVFTVEGEVDWKGP